MSELDLDAIEARAAKFDAAWSDGSETESTMFAMAMWAQRSASDVPALVERVRGLERAIELLESDNLDLIDRLAEAEDVARNMA